MAENMCIKRNTTAILPIMVEGVSYSSLSAIKIAFKSCNHHHSPILIDKEYKKADAAIVSYGEAGFTVNVMLKPEETFKLEPGEAYADVYPITSSGVINTGEPIRYDVIDTHYEGVIS